MIDPNYYIRLCARKYAETTRLLVSTDDPVRRNELTALLQHLKQAAVWETITEQRRRLSRLPIDMRQSIDRKQTIVRLLSSKEAEALRYYYAVPGGGLLGSLSGVEMMRLAYQFEEWSCTSGLDHHSRIQTLGFSDGVRSMAFFLGVDHTPRDAP